jgi:hypothetical protein
MSESAQITGLTGDTIIELMTQFSDLIEEGFDLNDLFYESAEGVKVDSTIARMFTEADYQKTSDVLHM